MRFPKSAMLLLFSLTLWACSQAEVKPTPKATLRVAVFVPGVLVGSPTYELMAEGVKQASEEKSSISYKIIEGGFNQAEWEPQVAALAASQEFDVVITSNPAMPEICARVALDFPEQKFITLEGYLKNNPSVASFYFNHRELAYLHGYLAGLLSLSKTPSPARVGMLVGQEYPEMIQAIRPGVTEGLLAADPQGMLEFRVLGNWYDAAKGAEITSSLFGAGVQVMIPIAGSANQGVFSTSKKEGKLVLNYDSPAYELEPGVIVGGGIISEDRAAREMVLGALAGTLVWGSATIAGIKDGYIGYDTNSPQYQSLVPQDVQTQFLTKLEEIRTGALVLPMPGQQ